MNTKEYIESGIIESYILGTVSAQEKQEVECMAHIYPEIKEELDRTAAALESYARTFSKKAPEVIKDKIFATLGNEDTAEEPQHASSSDTETKVIRLTSNENEKNIRFWKYSAAAGIVFFLTTSTFLILQKGKYEGMSDKLAEVSTKLDSSQKQLAGMSADMRMQNSRLDFYTNPENKVIAMKGLEKKDPSALALICYNKMNNEVFIDVKQLPQPPVDKQYQLWAIVDGKPVDLGVMDLGGPAEFHKMKTVAAAQAFAVTLENKGGSPVPTMEEMYVIGNV